MSWHRWTQMTRLALQCTDDADDLGRQ
jgi:hypothetical protein